jgi:rubrerythrin
MSVHRRFLLRPFVFVPGIVVLSVLLAGCSSVGAPTLVGTQLPALSRTPTETLKNLQVAFNGESNARARYLAFAEKADADGYGKVASLFRAAARAEEIHAYNHAQVIGKLGGAPTADIKLPEVGDTAANLEAALQGEMYERDTMYPDFLKQARQDGSTDAIRTFRLALNAEAEHAKLYGGALMDLKNWKGVNATFYVCPVCGFTTNNLNFERCPSSYTPRERFLEIK